MTVPAQAVVDERNELLRRLQGPEVTGEDLISLVSQPPGLFHDARRIISESSLTLGGWIESYSRSPNAPPADTGQHIADWISSYYQHLDHASVLTLADLRRFGLKPPTGIDTLRRRSAAWRPFTPPKSRSCSPTPSRSYDATLMSPSARRPSSESIRRHPPRR